MRPVGKLTIYALQNTAEEGLRPDEKLVKLSEEYYYERRASANLVLAAMSANQRIDKVVRITKVRKIPEGAEYVVLEDDLQYRIALMQRWNTDIDLTLVRLEKKLDVLDADEDSEDQDSSNGG